MLYKRWLISFLLLGIILLGGCSSKNTVIEKNNPVPKQTKNYQIGVLLSKLNSNSENEKIVKGINKATKKSTDIKAKFIKPGDFVDAEEGLRYLAENSYDLIIAVGDEEAKVTNKLAKEYPEVSFGIINVPTYSPNLASLQFKDEEGVFLAGVLSGLLTKENKVAFVGGLEKMPEKNYQRAYTQGVDYISKEKNQEIEVITEYTGDSWDTKKINDTIKILSDKGVDIFFNGFGRNQEDVILAAAANKKHAIGIGENQRVTAPRYVYTSIVDNLDALIYRFVMNTKTKGFKSGIRYFGLTGGCVSLLDFNKISEDEKSLLSKKDNTISINAFEENKADITPEVISKINLIKEKIRLGKIIIKP